MSIGLMQERPPYIRFEVGTVEYRDNAGMSHSRDVELIKVTPAGSKDVHEAIADEWIKSKEQLARQNPPQYHPEWANRFRQQYQLWKQGYEIPVDGTSIRTWPVASPSEVKRCIDANVLTVEDLAQANEEMIRRLGMGARELMKKAKLWIEERDGPGKAISEVAAMRVLLEERDRQIGELTKSVELLSEKMADLAPKKSRRQAVDTDEDVIK